MQKEPYESVYGFWDWMLLLLLIYELVQCTIAKS